MPNPWDIPPAPSVGDRDENNLFAAIGRALTEWEQVEAACAELFAIVVSVSNKSTHQAPAIRAYGTVISFPARCEMLKAAADAYFHRRKKKKVQFSGRLMKLLNDCQQFSARRNEIAHGRVINVVRSRGNKNKQIGFLLIPSFYNPKKYKIDRIVTYQYSSKEVIYFSQEFTKLYLQVYAFGEALGMPPITGTAKER
jgi:hypothetical protein